MRKTRKQNGGNMAEAMAAAEAQAAAFAQARAKAAATKAAVEAALAKAIDPVIMDAQRFFDNLPKAPSPSFLRAKICERKRVTSTITQLNKELAELMKVLKKHQNTMRMNIDTFKVIVHFAYMYGIGPDGLVNIICHPESFHELQCIARKI